MYFVFAVVTIILALCCWYIYNGLNATKLRLDVVSDILDNIASYVFILDSEGIVVWQNNASMAGTGMDICGRDIADLIPSGYKKTFTDTLWPGITSERTHFIEAPIHTVRDSLLVAFERRNSPCGEYIVLTGHDLTEKVRRLKDESYRDHLTGLYNRAGFWAAAEHLPRQDRLVLVCDLDGLKQVNDTMGHAAGDALICNAATALQSILRSGDVLARAGGDEFWLVAPNIDQQGAQRLCERIDMAMNAAGVSMSLGQATGTESLHTLLEHADAAMYRTKTARKEKKAKNI